jgi:hypothetical protein
MSIFASYVTRIVPLPFDTPHEVTIQKLPAKALAAAREASIAASFAFVKTIGGTAMQKEIAGLADPDAVAERLAERQADPLRSYDRSTVLAKGVKAWTYSEPVTPDTLDDLDEEAAEFLAREILALTLPNGSAEKKSSS